jgi:serine/threonine protein kinase/tetratricopeptide (TPR) repeat protein
MLPPTVVQQPPEPKTDWKHELLASVYSSPSRSRLEQAACSYREFRQQYDATDIQAVDAWCDSQAVDAESARYFREVHASDAGQAYRLAEAVSSLPEAGSDFLSFHLLGELGRGAFGRVFLAEQEDLANRYVALKVAADVVAEAQNLAQLQHTNIVPIYSIHRAGPLQAVCMPFLGATTLADVLHQLGSEKVLPASGKLLVSTLNDRKATTRNTASSTPSAGNGSAQEPQPPQEWPALNPPQGEGVDAGVTLKMLEGLTYVEAVLWMGARLTDGLAHAHEHGILHRDLKPANILLTDDGQPMLLDFNLSANTNPRSSALGASIGGTLPYMAPEQLEAFQGRKRHLDARCDVYSLGIVLYELLAGQRPFATPSSVSGEVVAGMVEDRLKGPSHIRAFNPAVSPAVESMVRHCLEPDPARRYQSARELHEDLERHLHHLPLKHAAETSLIERVQKWIHRHPRLTSITSVALVATAIIALLAAGFVARGRRVARQEAVAGFQAFEDQVRTAQFLLSARNIEPEEVDEGVNVCRAALDSYGVIHDPSWRQRAGVRHLDPEQQGQLQEEVAELLLLLADALSSRAHRQTDPQAQKDEVQLALAMNVMAESRTEADPLSRAHCMQRAKLVELLGRELDAGNLRKQAEATPLRTVRDLYLAAREYEKQGNPRKALPLLQEATRRDPRSFSAWFVQGDCHDALAQDADAVACFSACIALRPDFYPAWLNRGLSCLKQRFYERACSDFDRVISLRPDCADAYLNRALAKEGMERYAEALSDLTAALQLGTPRTRVYFMRAYARRKAGDVEGARRDLEEGLRRAPADEKSWIARGVARIDEDPQGALADFNQALSLNPSSVDALQDKAHVLAEKLGRNEEAVRVLSQSVALNPDYVPARAGRGVLLARLGRRAQALDDAQESLLLDARPPNLYQVACVYALTARQHPEDRVQALQLLSSALRSGFGLDLVDGDRDLDPIRKEPEFRRLVQAARVLTTTGR